MGRELGRISGPLLADNLRRNGADLAFETSLMYLDMGDRFVGFNTSTPTRDLEINGDTLTDSVIVDNQADIGGIYEIRSNIIQNFGGAITISPSQIGNPRINTGGTQTDNLRFLNSILSSTTTNTDILLSPTSGQTNFNSVSLVIPNNVLLAGVAGETFTRVTQASWDLSGLAVGASITNYSLFARGTTIIGVSTLQNDFDQPYYIVYTSSPLLQAQTPGQLITAATNNDTVLVNGNLHATGDVTWDGNIVLGNAPTDLIDFNAEVKSAIVPSLDATYSLGSNVLYFGTTYANNYNTTSLQGKNLNPVVSINYPTSTGLVITGTTLNVPNSGMAISSSNGTGVLNFVSDMVINGGFETGDLSYWTQIGNLTNTIVIEALGGFDRNFNGIGSFGSTINNAEYLDANTIQFDNTISILQLGTTLTVTHPGNILVGGIDPIGQTYFIGSATLTSCKLFSNLNDATDAINALGIGPVASYSSGVFGTTNSALTLTGSSNSSNYYTALTTYAISSTDKIMFSIHIDSVSNNPIYIGIATHQVDLGATLGVNGRVGGNISSYAFSSTGSDTNGNATPTFGQGDAVDVAVDRINGKIWIRISGGLWNNDAAQNPTLNIGGYDISYLAIGSGGSYGSVNGNFLYPGVSLASTNLSGFLYKPDVLTLITVTPYSLPGNFAIAHVYPGPAHTGFYFLSAAPQNTLGGINQVINTLPGVSYTVGWWLKVQSAITGTGAAASASISFAGTVLETITNDIDLDFKFRSYTVTATDYTATISVQFRNDTSVFMIDDISCVVNTPYFVGNEIRNISSGKLTLQNSDRGWTAFNSTTGAVLPVGTTSNRPSVVQTGLTRYNTTLGYSEIYNGVKWQMIADAAGYATQDEIQNILNVWSIILG